MTNDELKAAMTNGEPVEHRGITYSQVTAVIYRYVDNKPYIQVELLDRSKNSVVIASASEVKRVNE
ncbi:hypothetical protein M5X00_28385, partial [Paenibacillus alvei]